MPVLMTTVMTTMVWGLATMMIAYGDDAEDDHDEVDDEKGEDHDGGDDYSGDDEYSMAITNMALKARLQCR